VLGVVQLYAVFLVALLAFFEWHRRRAYCYGSRLKLSLARCAAFGARGARLAAHAAAPPGPGAWLRAVATCPDDALLALHGVDAYACVSFLRLCLALAAGVCALSCATLLPAYWAVAARAPPLAVDDDATRQRAAFMKLTLGAISTRAFERDAWASAAAWLAVADAYVLALFVYAKVREAYRRHRDARLEWLLRGDPDWPREASRVGRRPGAAAKLYVARAIISGTPCCSSTCRRLCATTRASRRTCGRSSPARCWRRASSGRRRARARTRARGSRARGPRSPRSGAGRRP